MVRVNVTFKPEVLRVLDGYPDEQGLTRAAALERAVHLVIRSKDKLFDGMIHKRVATRIVGGAKRVREARSRRKRER